MDEKQQAQQFANELDNLVERFSSEYDITYASIIGVMQMKIHLLCTEAEEQDGEDNE